VAKEVSYLSYASPLGELHLASTAKGLSVIAFDKREIESGSPSTASYPHLKEAIAWLDVYFANSKKKKPAVEKLPSLDLAGTPFQKDVWKELLAIPFGKTLSYSELAIKLDKPSATRAIANACGKNPLLLMIPCHRVLRKNGELGGFRAGVQQKARLLDLEDSNWLASKKRAA